MLSIYLALLSTLIGLSVSSSYNNLLGELYPDNRYIHSSSFSSPLYQSPPPLSPSSSASSSSFTPPASFSSEYDTMIPFTAYQVNPGSRGSFPWLAYFRSSMNRDLRPSYGYYPSGVPSLSSSPSSSSLLPSSSSSGSSARSTSSAEAKSLMDEKRSSSNGNIGSPADMIFGKKSEKPFRTWGGR